MLFGIFLFSGIIIAYVLLMIYFPEWVGITGKVALKNLKDHQGDSANKNEDPNKSEKN